MNLEKLTASGKADLSLLALPGGAVPVLDSDRRGDDRFGGTSPAPACAAGGLRSRTPHYDRRDPERSVCRAQEGSGLPEAYLRYMPGGRLRAERCIREQQYRDPPVSGRYRYGDHAGPRFIARAKRSEFIPVYLPLADPVPSRTLVVAYRNGRYLSKAADAFIDTFKQVMDKLVVEGVQDK